MSKKLTYLAYALGLFFIYPILYQPVHGMLDHSVSSNHPCCEEWPAGDDVEWFKTYEDCAVCEYEIAAFDNAGVLELPEVTLYYYFFQASTVKRYLTSGKALLPDPRGPPQV